MQDFTYYGAFGSFKLDDPATDDGDGVPNSFTYNNVSPGSYNFSEQHQPSWELDAIVCTPATRATVNLSTRSVQLQVQAGDNIVCTFVNERLVSLEARVFNDLNGDSNQQSSEPYLAGWSISIYNGSSLVYNAVTGSTGSVSKTNLSTGTYKVCMTPQSNWTNTLPGTVDATKLVPCYDVTLTSGQGAVVYFGNAQPVRSSSVDAVISPSGGVKIYKLADINEAPTASNARNFVYLPVVIH